MTALISQTKPTARKHQIRRSPPRMGYFIATRRSRPMTTITKVDKFKDSPCMNLTNLHSTLPPNQDTVAVHADSALRQKSDTSKSATASSLINRYIVLLSLWLVLTILTITPMFPTIENQAIMPRTTDLLKALVVNVGASSGIESLLFA